MKRIIESKKGFIVVLTIILSLFFIGSFTIIAKANPFIVDSVNASNTFEYNRYPLENYTLDFYYDSGNAFLPWNWGDGTTKLLGTALNILTNVILSISNLISYFVGYIVEQAFSLDFITDIVSNIKPIIQSVIGFNEKGLIPNGLLSGFIMLLITILGCYLVYVGLLKREVTKVVSSILAFIVVMFGMVAYSLFADKYLIKLNNFSKEVSSSMLNIGNNAGVSVDEQVTNETVIAGIRDRLFQIQIQKPYLLLQYGTSNINEINESDPNRISSILKYDSDSKEREEAVKKEVQNGNRNMGISGLGSRLGNVMLMFILNLIFSIVILMFIGAMLYYQILFLFYAIILPVNFLVGLVPGFSNNGVKGVTNLLGSVLKRQGLCLIVSLVFTISNFIYDVTDESKYGFLFVFCVQLLLFYVSYKKSHEVLSLFDFYTGDKNRFSKFFNNFNNKIRRLNKDKYKMNPFFDRRSNNKNNNDNRNSNINSNENNNRYTSKYKDKDNANKSLVNRNTPNRKVESSNIRELASRNGSKGTSNMKSREGLKEFSRKNKIKRLPNDTMYNVRKKNDPINNSKGNKANVKKGDYNVYNGAERKTYRRRINNDNKNRNENVSKKNIAGFKARESTDKKYNEIDRNVVSTNRKKVLRKRGNINERRK